MTSDIIFSLAIILVSIIWIIKGVFELGFWNPGVSAGSGFIPTIFAAVTLVSTVLVIISDMKKRYISQNEKADIKTEVQNSKGGAENKEKESKLDSGDISKCVAWLTHLNIYVPVLFCIAGIISLKLFGLVITVFAVLTSWLHFISRINWKKSLLVSSVITLVIYMVFEFWLGVPFPGDILKL
jgi:hypothetical protein